MPMGADHFARNGLDDPSDDDRNVEVPQDLFPVLRFTVPSV